jgi:hypothetical protein
MVDANLQPIAPSYWRYQGLRPQKSHSLSRMLIENQVCACTSMLNRALVQRVGDIPTESIHQDWWIALVAAAFGDILSVDKGTLLWRRHSKNNSEVSSLSGAMARAILGFRDTRGRLARQFEESRPRARMFLEPAQSGGLESLPAVARDGTARAPRGDLTTPIVVFVENPNLRAAGPCLSQRAHLIELLIAYGRR